MNNITWDDITIKQFKEIERVLEMVSLDEIDRAIQLLSIIDEEDEDKYLNMDMVSLKKELSRLKFILDGIVEEVKPNFEVGKYEIDCVKYSLTPSVERMTAGQFIDYKMAMSEPKPDISLLCATVLIPKGKKYGDGYDPLQLREKIYNNFKITEAVGISNFFMMAWQALYASTLHYSIRQLKKELKKEKNQERIETLNQSIQEIQKQLSGIPL